MRKMLIGALALVVLAGGCSTGPSFKYDIESQQVTIMTEPPGAEVWQTMPVGQPKVRLGVTPLEGLNVMVVKGLSLHDMPAQEAQEALRHVGNIGVEIRKEGFKPYIGFLAVKKGEKNEHRLTLEPLPR